VTVPCVTFPSKLQPAHSMWIVRQSALTDNPPNACLRTNGCVSILLNREKAGPCDVEEQCTGNNATCPEDNFVSQGTVCR